MRRVTVVAAVAAILLAACADDDSDSSASQAPDTSPPAGPTEGNVWRDVVNIAHAGGIHEAPANTLHAFRTAAERGADALEMDLHITADGEIVVIHDSTVDRTTDGSGCVISHTLEELRELDAAYTHVEGQSPEADLDDDSYPLRGIATGETEAPEGVEPEDLRIPTLAEVFEAVGDELMVIEMKPIEAEERDGASHDCPAEYGAIDEDERPYLPDALAELIEEYDMASQVLVASFVDELMHDFIEAAPGVDTSFPEGEGFAYFGAFQAGEEPENPNGHVAIQPPVDLAMDLDEDLIVSFIEHLHDNDIAAQVWTVNDAEVMTEVLGWGADGIITDRVQLLAELVG